MTDGNHRLALGAGWKFWPWLMVRAAGFPAAQVLRLGSAEAAAIADALLATEEAARSHRLRAIEELRRIEEAGGEHARAAQGALHPLQHGKLPRDKIFESPPVSLHELREAEAARTRLVAELERSVEAASAMEAAALRELATDGRFQEALAWQNPDALTTAIDWLRRHPTATNTDARRKLTLVAMYLQRYCVKNDTIGFFGPICFGTLTAEHRVTFEPGPTLLASRHVQLEDWAIDAYAQTIAADPALRPYIAPRLLSSVAIDGTTLHFGIDQQQKVPAAIARVLAACDGVTPAIEIAGALVSNPESEIETADELYELLDQLVGKKVILWTLQPRSLTKPEDALLALLERMPGAVAARPLADLAELEAARKKVAAAGGGDVLPLRSAIDELSSVFERISGQSSNRRPGQTYAGRTPLYEDCIRDLRVEIGAPVLDRLAPVLQLVGQSARWFTYELARHYRAEIDRVYRSRERDAAGVKYIPFILELDHLFPPTGVSEIFAAVQRDLEERWSRILAVDFTARRAHRTSAELRDAVMQTFAAPSPGWKSARFLSPDVMIAATSVDALTRGDFTLVLGEAHIGNTLVARMMAQHGPPELGKAYSVDVPDGRVIQLFPRDTFHRATNLSWSPNDVHLETGENPSWLPPDQVLRLADLRVRPHGTTFAVHDLRSGRTWEFVEIFDIVLRSMAANLFRPAPRAPHLPRISIDNVVIAREQWRFTKDQLPAFRDETNRARLFAAAHAWANEHGIPRRVFVKIPEEAKPSYIDLASPTYVEILARALRKASALTVSEMMPDVSQTWLPDAAGNTYTAELRFACVDPVPWTPHE